MNSCRKSIDVVNGRKIFVSLNNIVVVNLSFWILEGDEKSLSHLLYLLTLLKCPADLPQTQRKIPK